LRRPNGDDAVAPEARVDFAVGAEGTAPRSGAAAVATKRWPDSSASIATVCGIGAEQEPSAGSSSDPSGAPVLPANLSIAIS